MIKDWLAELLFNRVMDLREFTPGWAKDYVDDGGLIAVFSLGVVLALVFVGNTA